MTKKIFKIIGIVVGSVAVFCGAVFGVMALMGKFKTPVIYPTILKFEQTEMTVVERATYNPQLSLSEQEETPTRYEFKLVGTNPEFDRPVNQTECYVWFKNSEGAKLITLCDVNLNPLTGVNNRYLVQCNEPIYFMANKIADNGILDVDTGKVTDGVAILEARSVNETLKKPDAPLSLYIDREVEAVYVNHTSAKDEPNIGDGAYNTQKISLGTDMDLNFEYKVITELSHRPISAVNAKEIELYFDATGIADDYIPVTQEEIAKTDSPLYNLIRYEDNKFILNGTQAGNYTFIVAVFATYEDKTNYEASIEGEQVAYPYVHRTNAMLKTKLEIEVQEISISSLTFERVSDNLIPFDLYAQDNHINLDGEDDLIYGAKNYSLGAQLWLVDNLVEDTTRLDGFKFADFTSENMWYGSSTDIIFKNGDVKHSLNQDGFYVQGGEIKQESDGVSSGLKVELSNLKLGKDLTVINYIYEDGQEGKQNFYSVKSWAVLDESVSPARIKLLRPGNYLNFYVKSTDASENEYFVVATEDQFKFNAKSVEGLVGKEKSWQIVAQSIPTLQQGESLALGAFVVNGSFTNSLANSVDNFFEYVGVKVDVESLTYEVLSNTNVLDVNFVQPASEKDKGVIYSEKSFEDIVNITGGSYSAGVLLTTDNAKVETLKYTEVETEGDNATKKEYNYTYTSDEGTIYYIVGYFDDKGKFHNSVKLCGDWVETETLGLKMLLLHNEYGQTAEQFIESLKIPAENVDVKIENAQIVNGLTIYVKANYILNTNLMSVKMWKPTALEGAENPFEPYNKDNGVYKIYENVTNNIIEVLSTNSYMLEMTKTFYGGKEGQLPTINFNSHGIAIEVLAGETFNGLTDGSWRYKITKLIGDGDEIQGVINCGGEFTLPTIKVISGKPENIVFNVAGEDGQEGTQVNLFSSVINAENADIYFRLGIDYDGAKYVNNYTLINKSNNFISLYEEKIFNKNISSSTAEGFQSGEDKNQTYAIEYIMLNGVLSIEENVVKVHKVGVEILEVKIAGVSKFLKIVVASDLSLLPEEAKLSKTVQAEGDPITLNDLGVKIGYVNAEQQQDYIVSSKDNLVYITNVTCSGYDVVTTADGYAIKNATQDVGGEDYLTITNNAQNGWEFNVLKTYLSIKVSFRVVTIIRDIECEINFTSAVSVGLNDAWKDKIFYEGTTVDLANSSSNSVFKLTDGTGTGKFSYSVNGGDTTAFDLENGTPFLIPELETIDVEIYYNTTIKLDVKFTFAVLPNVIATAKEDVNLVSGAEYVISDLFELKTYLTNVVYGAGDNLYTEKTLTPLDNYSALAVKEDLNKPTISWNSNESKVVVGDMSSLNGTKKLISLQSGEIIVIEHEFVVKNKLGVKVNHEANDDDYYLFRVNKYHVPLYILEGITELDNYVLTDMKHNPAVGDEELKFSVADGMFIYDKNIIENKTINVTFTLTNKNNDEEVLIYTTHITLSPYTPDLKETINIAFSGERYDVLGELYNVEDLNGNIIYSLKVNRFLSESGVDITSSLVDNFVPTGYTVGVANPQCEVLFKDFAGDELRVKVEFVIAYNRSTSYTYTVPLTIQNRQTITVQYPETNLGGEQKIGFIFEDGYATDAHNLQDNSGKVRVANFEPILVYTNAQVSIDFSQADMAKNVVRASVANRTGNGNTNVKVELIAYETQANGAVSNKGKITTNGSLVTIDKLGATQIDFAAYYIFKLTTESLNYQYYFVRLYCTNLQVQTQNNIDVIAYQNGTYIFSGLGTTKVAVDIEISGVIDVIKSKFAETFSQTYNELTTTLWLYDGVETGGIYTTGEDQVSQWSKLSIDKTINELVSDAEKFTTLTIGLMHQNTNAQYVYGTITIYVQPNTNVELQEGVDQTELTFNKPNGEFKMDLSNSQATINSPLKEFEFDAQEIYVDGVLSSQIPENDVNYGLISTEEGLTITKRVAKDTIVRVKYAKGDTVVYVDYTYKATELPDITTTATEIGVYDTEKGFVTSINLADGENNIKKYFNTYVGDYQLLVGSKCIYDSATGLCPNSVDGITVANGDITFTQTAQQWEVDIKVVYSNFADGTQSRTFRFVVLAGVSVGSHATIGGDGSTMNSPYLTLTNENADIYKTNQASCMEIEKVSDESLTTFTIAGFEIRVNASDATMNLAFENGDYVFGDELGKIMDVDSKTLYFPHMATNKVLYVDIEIKVGESTYLTKRIYIEILKTYGGIKLNYLADGATHENVCSSSDATDLNEKFIGSSETNSERIDLLDAQGVAMPRGNYNLYAMGFVATEGSEVNPNTIVFTPGSDMSIINNQVSFYKVDANKMTAIYLSNNAGIIKNSVVYNVQIMAGEQEDGLILSTEEGRLDKIDDKEYMSFMMGEVDAENSFEKTYNLGRMLDEQNFTAFTLTNVYIGGTNSNIAKEEIRFNDGVPYQKNETSGEWNINAEAMALKVEEFGEIFDAIQYRFYRQLENEEMKYAFYITLHSNTNQVYVSVMKVNGVISASQTLQFGLGGVNGDETILQEFIVYLSNEKVTLKDDAPTSIYAYEMIDLVEVCDIKAAEDVRDNIKFEVAQGGTYSLNAQEKPIAANSNNILFTLTSNTIIFQPIGQDTHVKLRFDVKCEEYVITTIEYEILVRCNFAIIANGEAWNDSRAKDSMHTNYALTETILVSGSNDIEEDEKGIAFIDLETMKGMASNAIQQEDKKYLVLAYDAYRFTEETPILRNLVKLEIKNETENCGYKLVGSQGNYRLIFTKDHNSEVDGEIIIVLSIRTDIGTYSKEWSINVTPVVSVVSNYKENYKMQNGTTAYRSGNEVDLIGGLKAAITATKMTEENTEVSAGVEYSIAKVAGTTNIANKDLFNLSSDNEAFVVGRQSIDVGVENGDASNQYLTKAKINLPVVPVSLNANQSYYVTYRIVVRYLGLQDGADDMSTSDIDETDSTATARVFYITYIVSNEQKVETYVETDAEGKATYYASVDVTNRIGEDNILTLITANNETDTIKPVFKTTFLDAEGKFDAAAHIAFVKSIDGVRITKADGTVVNFAVTSDEYGNLTVNLSEGKDENSNEVTTLFNNELCAELALMSKGTKVVTVASYSEYNIGGFRLYAENTSLTANSSYKLSQLFGADPSLIKMNGITYSTEIIGVGTPDRGWVKNATSVETDDATDYATISVPMYVQGEDKVAVYTVKRALFKNAGGSSSFYTTEQYFYYIAGVKRLCLVDYASGINVGFFSVPYEPSNDGKISIDLSKSVKVWQMNEEGKLVSAAVDVVGVDIPDAENMPSSMTAIDATLQIDANDLQASADENYLTVQVVLKTETYGNFKATIKFVLPSN